VEEAPVNITIAAGKTGVNIPFSATVKGLTQGGLVKYNLVAKVDVKTGMASKVWNTPPGKSAAK
jgi:hypothetical protein